MCTVLAKEIIRSRKAVNKIYASKAQLNSVEMSMKNQLGEFLIAEISDESLIKIKNNFKVIFILHTYNNTLDCTVGLIFIDPSWRDLFNPVFFPKTPFLRHFRHFGICRPQKSMYIMTVYSERVQLYGLKFHFTYSIRCSNTAHGWCTREE